MKQTLVVLGDPFRCWRCGGIAAVLLVKQHEDERQSQIGYCDTCWIGETRSYQPLVQRDEQAAVSAAARILGDDEHKAGVKV